MTLYHMIPHATIVTCLFIVQENKNQIKENKENKNKIKIKY